VLFHSLKFLHYLHEAQEVAVQPLQPDDEEPTRLLAAPLSPPLLKPKTDIRLVTSFDPQAGQFIDSLLLNTSLSNCL